MKVTLKDGSFKEYAQPMAVIDIAKDISEGLARMACVAEIDGEVKDLRTIVDKDCTLNIFTAKDPEGLAALRHTASHVMAQAIKRLWPETKLAIGPSIADGFYYDIDRDEPVTSDDLAKIEAEMKKIIKEALPLERFELPRAEAIALMKEKNEPYKVELIEDLPEDSIISFYKQGEFTDLCAGPHLMNTKEVGKAFKLMNIAGAYWRGSEKNKMLTRIYATAFAKKEDLDAYVTMMEEAKKRDHRKLGKELGLFMMSDAGPGFPFFLPKGMILKNTLLDYWREIHKKAGYVYKKVQVLGPISHLETFLAANTLDEIVITLSIGEYANLEQIVAACEKSGVHTKFIPDYNNIIPTIPYMEDLQGLPVIHIRHVPLTSVFNATIKRMVCLLYTSDAADE